MPSSGEDGISVLHVDDDPSLAELTAEFLEREDERFSVETATSASDGLERLADEFDCIVSDYDMPRTNGIEFLEAVREDHPDLPFVLFTGKGSEEIASDAIAAGVTDYLQKGSGTSQYVVLANRIRNAVEGYRSRIADRRRRERRERQRNALLELTADEAVIAGEFETAARRITEIATDVLDVSRTNVWLLEDDGRILRCVDHYDGRSDAHDRGMELVADDYPAYFEALATHRAIDAADARSDPRTAELEAYLEEHDVGALLDATLRSEGEVVGVVCHELVGDIREWTDDEIEFASDVAEVVHRALRNRTRRERQRELERTRARFRAITENTAHAVVMIDDESTVRYVNDAVEDVFGYAPEELVGESLLTIVPERFRDDHREALVRYRRSGTRRLDWDWTELPGLHRDGHEVPLGISFGEATIDGERRFTAAIRDITERTERERTLETVETVFENARECQFVVDADGGDFALLRANGYYKSVVGLPPDEDVSGKTPVELFGRDAGRTIVDRYEECVERRETISYTVEAPVPEAGTVYRTILTPIVSDGDVTRIVGTARDITEHRELSRTLRRKNERLEQFASVVSHDLRNPLNVAEGQLELLREECESDRLATVESAIDRMDALIDGLLTLAREGEAVDDVEPVAFTGLAETCWRNVDTADATLVTDVDRTIWADRSRLQQLLENLVRNAVEHGGDDVTVTIGDLEGGAGFYVEDDGAGIHDDERGEIFESGYSNATNGTGLGLSIVQAIAEAHGWTVRVTDGEAGGTRFEIAGVESAGRDTFQIDR